MEIQKYKAPSLYKVARPVKEKEFGADLDIFMSDMATTMYASLGTGLAGPQVASDLRIIVADMGYLGNKNYGEELVKIVNPVVLHTSGKLVKAEEQCLSYPDFAAAVDRDDEIVISYQTPFGERREVSYKDWQARVILHEIDHLNGITLFTRASYMKRQRFLKKLEK